MLFDKPIVSEGSMIINTVVESGSNYPSTPDAGEIFFKTDINDFVFRAATSWNRYANLTDFQAHTNDNNRHLTAAEKTLISGITVTAADINSIPQMKLDITAGNNNLNTHKADMTLHLTAAQNTFLDGLNLPTLTAANVNTLVGQTVLLSTQFTNQTNATNAVSLNLATHIADLSKHVTADQKAWLDGIDMIKITPFVINSLDGIVAGGTAANRVLKTGDTMTGALNMGANKVTSSAAPTTGNDLTNKTYVDSKAASEANSKLPLAGGVMTGDIDMGGKKVVNSAAPTATTDLTNKTYVDGLQGLKVSKAGDTMSGTLNMGGNKITSSFVPTADADLTNKKYVDSVQTSVLSQVVLLTGSTMTGPLDMGGNQKIINVATPTAAGDVSTKGYVDGLQAGKLSLTGGTMSGAIAMGNQKITGLGTPTTATDASTKGYTDTAVSGRVLKAGDTMSGTLNMGAQKVTTTYIPVNPEDLTNKAYVDSRTASGGVADSAAKLTTGRHILIAGAVVGTTAVPFDGTNNATINTTTVDATKLINQVPGDSLTEVGFTMANTEAKDFYGSSDFNAMVHARGGGIYTIAATGYTNGPLANGAAATYTGILEVIRRKFNAGPAIIQKITHGYPSTTWQRAGNFNSSNVWVWSAWDKIAFESSTVAKADQLTTARKISLGNTDVSFNGSQDVRLNGDLGIAGGNLQFNSDMVIMSTQTGTNTRPFAINLGGNATNRITSVLPYEYSNTANRMKVRNESTTVNSGQYLDVTNATPEFLYVFRPGVAYTVSALARATADAELRQYIQCRNAAGTVIYTKNSVITKATGDWQRLITTIEANLIPADTVSMAVYYGRATRPSTLTSSSIFIELTEPMFQEGDCFSGYVSSVETAATLNASTIVDATQNWNALTTPGIYTVWFTLAAMVNAPPTSFWGKLIVTRTLARIVQEYITDTSPHATFTRWSKDGGNNWGSWVSNMPNLDTAYGASQVAITNTVGNNATIAAANDTQAGVMSAADKVKLNTIETGSTKDWGAGIPITTNGADLNSYTSPGAYFCSANAVSATLLNNPTTKAFALQVYQTAGCIQMITEYTSSGGGAANRMWVRGFYNNVWNDWQPIYTAGNPQLTTTTDAAGTNNTNIASTAFVQQAVTGQIEKVLTNTNVTLTAAEASNAGIRLSGTLTANVIVSIPTGIARNYTIRNVTSGNFTITVQQLSSAAKVIPMQGRNTSIYTDGNNVFEADDSARKQATDEAIARTSGILNKTGMTGGTITLTADEVVNEVMVFTGTLTSNLLVLIPNSTNRPWIVSNGTGGNFTLTLRSVTAGNTVVIPQGQRMTVFQNTYNIEEADTMVRPINRGGTGATSATGTGDVVLQVSPNLTGTPTAITAAVGTNNTQIATTAYVKNNLAALNASSLTTGTVPNARLAGLYDGISIKLNGSNSIFSTPGTGTQSTDGRTVYGMVEYRTAASTTKGCLVFVAPDVRNNVMHMMEITGRTHTGGDHLWKALIGGYGATAGWTNTRMMNLGTADLKARWGRNPDGKVCLILGDANTVWPYAHLSATVSMISHSTAPDSYVTGWTTALDDGTLTGYTLVTAEIANSAMLTDITGKANTADALTTARQINGTNFNGTGNITTANWGTARNLTIGNTAKSVNGSGNVTWSLAEIGAASANAPSFTGDINSSGYGLFLGNQGGSWIGGVSGVANAGSSTAHSSIRIATSTSTNSFHSWISQRTQTGVGYGIGTLGSDFFIAYGTKANLDSGNNNVTNIFKYEASVNRVRLPQSISLEAGSGEGQIYFSASPAYAYGNSGAIGYWNASINKGCSMDNLGHWNVGGNMVAAGDVVAFYSDERLKENITKITDPLSKVKSLDGVNYNANALAASFGYDTTNKQVGLLAQQVQKVVPEAIHIAPFDRDEHGNSKSGENYLTVKYEKLVPLLVEAIKELTDKVEMLEAKLAS